MKHLNRDHYIHALERIGAPAPTTGSGESSSWRPGMRSKGPGLRCRGGELLRRPGQWTETVFDGAGPGVLRMNISRASPRRTGLPPMVMRNRGFLAAEVPRWPLDVITFESEEVVIPSGVYPPLVPSIGFAATTAAFPQQKSS